MLSRWPLQPKSPLCHRLGVRAVPVREIIIFKTVPCFDVYLALIARRFILADDTAQNKTQCGYFPRGGSSGAVVTCAQVCTTSQAIVIVFSIEQCS